MPRLYGKNSTATNFDLRGIVEYGKGGRILVAATVSEDPQSLHAEAAMDAEIRSQKRDVA
jgi:hypothetical protein